MLESMITRADADPRRGLGRRHRGLRGRRRGDAVGRDRGRRNTRSRRSTMMDRIARRVQEDPLYFSTLDASRMAHEHTNSGCDQRRRLPGRGDGRCRGDRLVSPRSGATALRAARERPGVPILVLTPNLGDRAPPRAPVGRALRPPARHQEFRRHGAARRCASPIARRSPSPASASSLPPACRSAPPARPTSCASPGSTGSHLGPINSKILLPRA